MMNLKNLDREILQSLRGKRAQAALSKLLGYSFNQVYLWESGRRVIYWKDFENVCEKLRRPLQKSIGAHFYKAGANNIHELLRLTLAGRKKKEVAKKCDISPSKLSRWLNGKSDPPLKDVLKILAHVHLNFYEFLEVLVGEGKLASIQSVIARHRKLKEILFNEPFSAVIAPALGLKEYVALKRHEPGVLAKKLGITVHEEERLLRVLLKAEVIEFVEGKYRLIPYSINLVQDRERFLQNCHYWLDRAARVPKKTEAKSNFGYRIFGTTEAGRQKVRQATIDYYHVLTEIIKNEQGPFDHVLVSTVQLVLPEEVS